jgi:peroxiredoxin
MPDGNAGASAPAFRLPSTRGDIGLAELLANGRRAVLAFFTEADTPTCDTELAMLRDAHEMLAGFNASVLAISTDALERLAALSERMGLPFAVAADERGAVSAAYGVLDEASGRAQRALFVVAGGVIVLRIVPFQPSNVSQIEAVFSVLGAEA